MKVYTNATKRDPHHMIEVPDKMIETVVLPKFKHMPSSWKVVDAKQIMPGLKLHYRRCDDGQTRVSFEEPNNGVANGAHWYTEIDLWQVFKF